MRTLAAATLVVAASAAAAAAEPAGTELDTVRMALQALAGLVGVVGLVVVTRYLLLRWSAAGNAGSVRLREVVRLSPQQALYVVEVEGRRLLLGQHVQVVCELGPAVEYRFAFAGRLRSAARRIRTGLDPGNRVDPLAGVPKPGGGDAWTGRGEEGR